jgi:hypothetical protein
MRQHPLYRIELARQSGVDRRILFKVWGGIGDQICAEPTLRWALKKLDNCEVSLATNHPDLFRHLKFRRVFDLSDPDQQPTWDRYLVFETITPPDDSNMVWLFFSHMLTNCVDFVSLCALRSQLPIEEKEIFLSGREPKESFDISDSVFIHPGRHWPSKTFPKIWWDEVLACIKNKGITPVIIGGDSDTNKSTVNVDSAGCIDLRNKLTVAESVWLLQRAKVLITNDSSPLHMAASKDPDFNQTGKAWIGYIATCKHPDYITHWRRPDANGKAIFQWREENLGLGGMWDITPAMPNTGDTVTVDKVDPEILKNWLPTPEHVSGWAVAKLREG